MDSYRRTEEVYILHGFAVPTTEGLYHILQVDSLSRELSHKDDELEDAHRERELMMDQLRAAEHVRFDLEGSHDNYRRQLAGMDSQIDILKGRLQDANSEAASMKRTLQVVYMKEFPHSLNM